MKTKFNKRAFISLVTFFLSIFVLVTGIMLLIMPDASLAYWNRWSFLTLEKNQWESFHAVVSIYLTIIVIFHIIQNWKPMVSYMKSKASENFKFKKELMSAAIISTVVTIGSFTNSPISMVTELFEPVSNAWYSQKAEPPFEDAQALPLHMLAKVQDISIVAISRTFDKNGIKYDINENLEEIAENNNYSSSDLYKMIN